MVARWSRSAARKARIGDAVASTRTGSKVKMRNKVAEVVVTSVKTSKQYDEKTYSIVIHEVE